MFSYFIHQTSKEKNIFFLIELLLLFDIQFLQQIYNEFHPWNWRKEVIRDALVLLFTVQTYIFCTILELDSNEHPMVRLINCLQMKLYVTPTTVFHCTCACHYFNTIFSSYDQPWEPGLAKSVAHERWTNTHGQLWLRP